MANASTADGKYIFNFKRVKAAQEEKIKWLNELNSMLEKPEYFTFFYGLDKKLDLNNEITFKFLWQWVLDLWRKHKVVSTR